MSESYRVEIDTALPPKVELIAAVLDAIGVALAHPEVRNAAIPGLPEDKLREMQQRTETSTFVGFLQLVIDALELFSCVCQDIAWTPEWLMTMLNDREMVDCVALTAMAMHLWDERLMRGKKFALKESRARSAKAVDAVLAGMAAKSEPTPLFSKTRAILLALHAGRDRINDDVQDFFMEELSDGRFGFVVTDALFATALITGKFPSSPSISVKKENDDPGFQPSVN